MNVFRWSILISVGISLLSALDISLGAEIDEFSLTPSPGLLRADLSVLLDCDHPVGCLVLCPGVNGDGVGYLSRPDVKKFAAEQHLALASLSFASDPEGLLKGKGYYYPEQGSGDALLELLDRGLSGEKLPLLLYGFSGGAHFVSGFAEWKPDRVKCWCAFSAAWWTKPTKIRPGLPPGVVICGKTDPRYDASLLFFRQGRELGRPWCWLSLPDVSHQDKPEGLDFAFAFFRGILTGKSGVWHNIESKGPMRGTEEEIKVSPSAAWMPEGDPETLWKALHDM